MARIIIDTNLWISFLITNDFSKLDDAIFEKNTILVFSQELLDEFLEVASRPKFRRFFPSDAVETLIEMIEEYADFVEVTSITELCRDPKDNFLLALSKDGKVDYLITGDKDLLILENFENTEIITITDFLDKK